jgi:hypothetical protein
MWRIIALFLLAGLAFASVWILEPAIHYYHSANMNTLDSTAFTAIDKYVYRIFL